LTDVSVAVDARRITYRSTSSRPAKMVNSLCTHADMRKVSRTCHIMPSYVPLKRVDSKKHFEHRFVILSLRFPVCVGHRYLVQIRLRGSPDTLKQSPRTGARPQQISHQHGIHQRVHGALLLLHAGHSCVEGQSQAQTDFVWANLHEERPQTVDNNTTDTRCC